MIIKQKHNFFKITNLLILFSRFKFLLLIFLMIMAAFFEMLSLGLLLPVLNSFFDNSLYELYKSSNLIEIINIEKKETFILMLLIILLFFYVIKFVVLILINFFQNSFIMKIYFKISDRLFNKYINNNYYFHIENNTATLIRNLKEEAKIFIFGVLMPFFNIILEVFVLIFFIAFLFYFNPKITFIIFFTLLVFSILYVLLIRGKIINYGKKRFFHDKLYLQNVIESLSAIKEVKIANLEKFFTTSFKNQLNELTRVQRNFMVLQIIPKNLIEVIAVSIFVLILIYSNLNSYNLNEIVLVVGIYGAAAMRLIPMFTKIINSFQQYSFNKPSIEILYDELIIKKQDDLIFEKNIKDINFRKFEKIKIKNLSFSYPNSKKNILDNLDLEIHKGDTIGISGDSGSGKSTIADLITGLLNPSNGSITVDNQPIVGNLKNWRKMIGYCQQTNYILDDTFEKNIILDGNYDEKIFNRVIKIAKLSELFENLKKDRNNLVGEKGSKLSGGQRQRISLARVLYRNPEILILDEPTSALDEFNEKSIIENIFNNYKSKTIIFISHNLDLLDYCEIKYEIRNKQIIQLKK